MPQELLIKIILDYDTDELPHESQAREYIKNKLEEDRYLNIHLIYTNKNISK